MNRDSVIKSHRFVFNPKDNGDESLSLETKFLHNGDPDGIYTNQILTLQSNCNSASFELIGAPITPAMLRKLANELDLAECESKAIVLHKF